MAIKNNIRGVLMTFWWKWVMSSRLSVYLTCSAKSSIYNCFFKWHYKNSWNIFHQRYHHKNKLSGDSVEWHKFSPFVTEKPREACFDPGNIMNASRTGYDYKLGSQVSYNCHHGYTTVGGDTITCVMGNDGKPVWDKALPSCKGRRTARAKSCIQTATAQSGTARTSQTGTFY